MSYYYSFDQYPTKDLDDLWESFLNGTVNERIDAELATLKEEEASAALLPTVSKATFYEDREAWIQCEKNGVLQSNVRGRKANFENLKKQVRESTELVKNETDEKKLKKLAAALEDALLSSLQRRLIRDTSGYSESARDTDFRFFHQAFQVVMGIDLDESKVRITTEQWKTFFQALKPDFVEQQFKEFFQDQVIQEDRQENEKRACLNLLYTVRDLLRTCLQRGWDLAFMSELWEKDWNEKFLKEQEKRRIERLVEYRLAKK